MANEVALRDDTFEVLGAAHQLAQQIAKTEFVPTAMRNRPEAVLAAILAGREVGLKPMQALSQIAVIEGKPCFGSHAVRALVQAQGHKIWADPEPTATRAVIHLQRNGETHVYTATWTMDDVKRAGLSGRPNYQKYPTQMLIARATAQVCRLGAADVLGGMPYVTEELQDGVIEPPPPNFTTSGGGVTLNNSAALTGALAAPAPTEAPRHRRHRAATEPPPETDEPIPTSASEPQPGAESPPAPAATPAPTPAASAAVVPPQAQLAGQAQDGKTLTLAQQIGMLSDQLHIDRPRLIKAVTGKTSAREVTREEAGQILQTLRDIEANDALLGDRDGEPFIVRKDDFVNDTVPASPGLPDEDEPLPNATD